MTLCVWNLRASSNQGSYRRPADRFVAAVVCALRHGLSLTLLAAALPACAAAPGTSSPGRVVAWGDGEGGHPGLPSGLDGVIAIAVGYLHSLALKSDGTVVAGGCRGYDDGQCSVPAEPRGVTVIAA